MLQLGSKPIFRPVPSDWWPPTLEFVATYFTFYLFLLSSSYVLKPSTCPFHLILSFPRHVLYRDQTGKIAGISIILLTTNMFSTMKTPSYVTFILAQPFMVTPFQSCTVCNNNRGQVAEFLFLFQSVLGQWQEASLARFECSTMQLKRHRVSQKIRVFTVPYFCVRSLRLTAALC